jgi:peroxiredoxin Q/BCP
MEGKRGKKTAVGKSECISVSLTESQEGDVMLVAGDNAPEFTLADQNGATVKLADFRGRKLLIYFYPKADTPGCTKQACSVRDSRVELKKLQIDTVGISPDEPKAQLKFDKKYGLGFPLLSDPDHAAAKAYGVWTDKSLYGKIVKGIVRSSFLVDESGRITNVWYKVKPADTVPQALVAIQQS